MRNVVNMVDRSTWDQSFIDGVSTLPSNIVGDVQDDSSDNAVVETANVDVFPAIVSPRALLLWNGDPSDQPRIKAVVGTDTQISGVITNGFLNPLLNTNQPETNGFVGTPEGNTGWDMCGAVAAPPLADLTSDDRIYENTLDIDDCSTGTSVFFSQPSSPGSATVGDLPFQTNHHSAFLATGSRSRSALPSLEHTPSETAVFTAPTGVSVKCRVQSTASSGSISTSGLSSSRGSNCSTSDVSAAAASMHFRSSNSPPRSYGQASDSGNGSDDDRVPPFMPVPDGAPVRRTSPADDVITDTTTEAKAATHWQRDASDERVFGGLASAYSRVANFLPAWDLERLETVYFRLAVCGFYYGRMSIDDAAEKLCRQPVGTFVLRDSADSRFLFSVSVQTCRGPTSIRIAYRSGLFRLDCTPDQEHLLPTFDCALRLVSHYVRLCGGGGTGSGNCSA